jgi:DNA (cytosine-5)-methyltransferase 1
MKKYKTNQIELKDHIGESKAKTSNECSNTVVSFFAGCGGLDLGFIGGFEYKDEVLIKTSFNILAAYDIDEKCVDTYRQNIGEHIEVKDLSEADPREMPSSDVLIGGFPCQDFATCGPRKGLSSGRGRLYLAQVNYMNHYKPKLVVAENVPGLANINNGEDLKQILSDFSKCGYRFEVWNLYAPDFGIPQNRTRLFMIGVRNDLKGFPVKPKKTHENAYNTIEWAIEDLIHITDESGNFQSSCRLDG